MPRPKAQTSHTRNCYTSQLWMTSFLTVSVSNDQTVRVESHMNWELAKENGRCYTISHSDFSALYCLESVSLFLAFLIKPPVHYFMVLWTSIVFFKLFTFKSTFSQDSLLCFRLCAKWRWFKYWRRRPSTSDERSNNKYVLLNFTANEKLLLPYRILCYGIN